jgi:electron transport complex protein RnfG
MSDSEPSVATDDDVDGDEAAVTSSGPGAVMIYGVVLSVGVVCALAIVSVYEFTGPIIQRNRVALRQRAILEVLPGATSSAAFRLDPSSGEIETRSADSEESDLLFAGYDDDGELVGLAIETQGMGYQDIIRVLYGYSFDKQAVIGTSVLESRETPGLGDRIEKDDAFLANFERLDVRLNEAGTEVANEIKFVKPGEKTEPWQIDGITGATISSRAMANMLSDSTAQWIPKVHSREGEFAGEKEGT